MILNNLTSSIADFQITTGYGRDLYLSVTDNRYVEGDLSIYESPFVVAVTVDEENCSLAGVERERLVTVLRNSEGVLSIVATEAGESDIQVIT
jgi:hypothetical protein